MAKRKAQRPAGRKKTAGGSRRKAVRKAAPRPAAKRAGSTKRRAAKRPASRRAPTRARQAQRSTPKPAAAGAGRGASAKVPALDRKRRTLEETVPTPPSSLDMDRHASAARTGRAELREKIAENTAAGPALTGGDVDANWEEAYTSGDEAPGGDNPTPDESVVDDIGKSLGVEYEDNEELRSTDKIDDRDAKRWELDPASSEDYRDRNKK